MKNFKLVRPNITHQAAAIEFAQEFLEESTSCRGPENLGLYLNDYRNWLENLEFGRTRPVDDNGVPHEIFFFMGNELSEPERILGICAINYQLNSSLWASESHIRTFSIRPSERRHGYGKVMLYLLLCVCREHRMSAIVTEHYEENFAAKLIVCHLGGEQLAFYNEPPHKAIKVKYVITVNSSVNNYKWIYEPQLAPKDVRIPPFAD